MCRMPRPSANAEGRFFVLDVCRERRYTKYVKSCANGPRTRITDGNSQKREQLLIRQPDPRRYGYGRISASGNCVWAVREV